MCTTCIKYMIMAALNIILPCRINFLSMFVWCWNITMAVNGFWEKKRGKTIIQKNFGGRGDMVGWQKERWVHPLLKRVIRRALLELLSRLNGATEGNIESIISVSLTYSPPPSLFLPHDSSNIFPNVVFFSPPPPFFLI